MTIIDHYERLIVAAQNYPDANRHCRLVEIELELSGMKMHQITMGLIKGLCATKLLSIAFLNTINNNKSLLIHPNDNIYARGLLFIGGLYCAFACYTNYTIFRKIRELIVKLNQGYTM